MDDSLRCLSWFAGFATFLSSSLSYAPTHSQPFFPPQSVQFLPLHLQPCSRQQRTRHPIAGSWMCYGYPPQLQSDRRVSARPLGSIPLCVSRLADHFARPALAHFFHLLAHVLDSFSFALRAHNFPSVTSFEERHVQCFLRDELLQSSILTLKLSAPLHRFLNARSSGLPRLRFPQLFDDFFFAVSFSFYVSFDGASRPKTLIALGAIFGSRPDLLES